MCVVFVGVQCVCSVCVCVCVVFVCVCVVFVGVQCVYMCVFGHQNMPLFQRDCLNFLGSVTNFLGREFLILLHFSYNDKVIFYFLVTEFRGY